MGEAGNCSLDRSQDTFVKKMAYLFLQITFTSDHSEDTVKE